MKNIVIDTNVIVSAMLSPTGNPAKITALISGSEDIQVYYSAAVLSEYERVLAYKRLKISTKMQRAILSSFKMFGIQIDPPVSTIPLPDETDRIFYDTAKASGAILITGNTKHYPAEPFIMTPAEFLSK